MLEVALEVARLILRRPHVDRLVALAVALRAVGRPRKCRKLRQRVTLDLTQVVTGSDEVLDGIGPPVCAGCSTSAARRCATSSARIIRIKKSRLTSTIA